jgi:hypothetical protein
MTMSLAPIDIGDVTLTPRAGLLHLTMAAQQSHTTWSVAGAHVAILYLQQWVAELARQEQTHPGPCAEAQGTSQTTNQEEGEELCEC